MRKSLLFSAALIAVLLAACGTQAGMSTAPAAGPPPEGQTPVAAVAPPPANSPLSGPLVGFYIEDSYQDVYLSIFDAGTGAFRVIQSATPIYIGEAQWFDDGCRLFVHGQLLDLHGVARWSIPPEVAGQIADINAAALSPDRNYIAHVTPVEGTGNDPATAVEVVPLSPPYDAVRLTAGAGAVRALAWSVDGQSLYFTGHDAGGVPQVYRATPDGTTTQQLTSHSEPITMINVLAPSPDGRHLAYGVRNLVQAGQPYAYQPTDEGWVGIIDLETGANVAVRPEKFGSTEGERGLVWDPDGDALLIIGDSLPVAETDPLAGRRIIWVTPAGQVTRALATADGPSGEQGHIGWVVPSGSIDTLLVNVFNDYYLYEGGAFQRLEGAQIPPLGIEIGRRPLAVLPAPVGFPGEAACGEGE